MTIKIESVNIRPIQDGKGMRYSLNLQISNDTEVLAGLYPSKTTAYAALGAFLDLIPVCIAPTEDAQVRGQLSL